MELTKDEKDVLKTMIMSNQYFITIQGNPPTREINYSASDEIKTKCQEVFGGKRMAICDKYPKEKCDWCINEDTNSECIWNFVNKLDYMLRRIDPYGRRIWLHKFFPELYNA